MALLVESLLGVGSSAAVPNLLALVLGRLPDGGMAGVVQGILS